MVQNLENQRRIKRKISAVKTKHMSNTKWRKFFAVLHTLPLVPKYIEIKLVGTPHTLSEPVPGPQSDFDDHFGECGNITNLLYSHIEYVQISNSSMTNQDIIQHLNQTGQWPIKITDKGIRISGYEWN